MIFTQEQINEIKQRLSLSGIKDSELDKLDLLEHPLTGKEVITLIKDGENLRISVEDLYEEFAKYIEQSENKEDFFNVSVYLGRLDPEFENAAKPCTLEEAINACPPYIRRAGQMISFLDSSNMKWETYQYIGAKDDDWEDITLFKNRYPVPADEVFDDAQGKKQSVINSEVKEEITAKQDAIEDLQTIREGATLGSTAQQPQTTLEGYGITDAYTKEEVNNLITTPDQKYVTVEATAETQSVREVLPQEGESDTIYRVGSWDGTQYTANVYSEYAWEGSNYIFLSKKEIGIDSEPTAGSNNLVKSGGVFKELYGESYPFASQAAISAGSSTSMFIFNNLEAGKTYHLKSNVAINIEYYKTPSGYAHLFDNKSEVDFVCPADYDSTQKQIVVNKSSSAAIIEILVTEKEGGLYGEIKEGDAIALQSINVLDKELNQYVETLSPNNYTKIDGIYNNYGEIVGTGNYWHSSPIALKRGETIYLKTEYIGAAPFVVQVQENGTFIKGRAKVKTQVSDGYECSYTASEDMYVSITYLISGSTYLNVTSLTITHIGIVGNINALDDKVYESFVDIEEDDYTKIDGYIGSTGNIVEPTLGWHSSPIALLKGEKIYLATLYAGGYTAIALTDSSGSYYHPVVSSSEKVQNADGYACSYVAMEDCYVSVTYQKDNGVYRNIDILRKIIGGIESADIKASIYSKNNLLDYIKRTIQKTGSPNIQNIVDSIDSCNIKDALFEREVMRSEVAGCTNEDILVQGTCGYYDDGQGNITPGTITWKIYKNGILHIAGYGKMYDFIKGVMGCENISQVNAGVASLGEEFWYYGFISPNVNNITPYFPTNKYLYGGTLVTYTNPKRYMPNGESINPINNLPYGYSAPWYIYRTETDFVEYTTKAHYDAQNPNGYKYNRVLIDEDITHGGITYIGDWAFYRVTAKSLVLPQEVNYIGCWGVRYSETIRTLVMWDNVTTIEDHGVSRMSNLETARLSSSLSTIGYGGMQSNPLLRKINLPALSSMGENCFYNDLKLIFLNLGQVVEIPKQALSVTGLTFIDIPISVTSIGVEAFESSKIEVIKFPANVTTIGNLSISDTGVSVIIIDSPTIASTHPNAFSLSSVKYVLIKNTLTIEAGYYNIFMYIGDLDGYSIFAKKELFPYINIVNLI